MSLIAQDNKVGSNKHTVWKSSRQDYILIGIRTSNGWSAAFTFTMEALGPTSEMLGGGQAKQELPMCLTRVLISTTMVFDV